MEEANKVTKDRGSKKVEAYHLYVSPALSSFLSDFGVLCYAFIFLPTSVLFRFSSVISPFFDLSVFGLPPFLSRPLPLSSTLLPTSIFRSVSLCVFCVLDSSLQENILNPHRKHAVETTEMLDFLKEIVESVPDPSAGGTVGLETGGAEAKKKRGKGRKGLAAAGGEGGEGSTAPKRKRKPKKGKDGEVKEEEEKERDENGDTEMGDEEGSAYYRPKSPVGTDEEEDKPFMPRR